MSSVAAQQLDTWLRLHLHSRGDRSRLESFRDRKLRFLIQQATARVPYYQSLFQEAGISPSAIQTAADLAELPVSSAQDYRERPLKETLAEGADLNQLFLRPTSGSSGRPFVVRRAAREEHLINAFRLRAHAQCGLRSGDLIAAVVFFSKSHQRGHWVGRLRQRLGIRRLAPVNCLASADQILDRLIALQPDVIQGFPGAITQAAQRALERGVEIRPRRVICGGETVTPFRRRMMEQAFGCPVYSFYGAQEFNLLAWQCPDTQAFHICEDNVVLEVLRDGRPAEPGELGEVVATGLHSYQMPFIRYRIGDVVRQGDPQCGCGKPFATLQDIRGRRHDYFVWSDGALFHPDRVVVPIMEAEAAWFDQYQLIQETHQEVVLRISPSRPPTSRQLEHVDQLARAELPSDVVFRIELVEAVPPEPSGKQRYCVSRVASGAAEIGTVPVAAE
ncbi:MAG: hypothetical protein P8M78_09295 [Myxococcota bacterium]|nr:hypothetical protein [Myxococcota bacterium]